MPVKPREIFLHETYRYNSTFSVCCLQRFIADKARAQASSHITFYGSPWQGTIKAESANGSERSNKYVIWRQRTRQTLLRAPTSFSYAVFITCRCFPIYFFISFFSSHSAYEKPDTSWKAQNSELAYFIWVSWSESPRCGKRFTCNMCLGVYRRKQIFAVVGARQGVEQYCNN